MKRVAIHIFLILSILVADAYPATKNWVYTAQLGEALDSVRFSFYVKYDSAISILDEFPGDSLHFDVNIDDAFLNEFKAKYYFTNPVLPTQPNSWSDFYIVPKRSVTQDSIQWKIREFFHVTVDTLIRERFTNYVLFTDTFLNVDSLIDSVHIKESDQLTYQYTQIYNDDVKKYGFKQHHPGVFSPIISPNTDSVCVFLVYKRQGVGTKGARLIVLNLNTANDTSVVPVIIGPVRKFGATDSIGFVQLCVPVSTIYDDSLKSLYDITLQFRGSVIARWDDLFLPDQDTIRLLVP